MRGRVGGGEGSEAKGKLQGLVGHRKDWGFYPSEVGPLEGRKQS